MQRSIIKIEAQDIVRCANGKAVYMLFVTKGVRMQPRNEWPFNPTEYIQQIAEDIEKPCTMMQDVGARRLIISQPSPVASSSASCSQPTFTSA